MFNFKTAEARLVELDGGPRCVLERPGGEHRAVGEGATFMLTVRTVADGHGNGFGIELELDISAETGCFVRRGHCCFAGRAGIACAGRRCLRGVGYYIRHSHAVLPHGRCWRVVLK
jgi:hypothetical protein